MIGAGIAFEADVSDGSRVAVDVLVLEALVDS